ncbi:MAG: hypothetical protein PHR51_02215 [Patescibacteria group bacterium]|nr:hypothetical protein [Patescibacteria group bacterium]
MNDSKWADLITNVESKFEVLENSKYDIEDIPNAFAEVVVFMGPLGKMKLERVTRPRVVGEKTFGGSKYGAASGTEKIYSEDEFVNVMRVYREVGGEWQEVDEGMFG